MQKMAVVFWCDTDIPELDVTAGTRIVFHYNEHTRPVFSVVRVVDGRFVPGEELTEKQISHLLSVAHHLHRIHLQPPSSQGHLRGLALIVSEQSTQGIRLRLLA